MKLPWRREPQEMLPSEKGFLAFAGPAADLPVRDAVMKFRELVSADMDWADSRKVRFRTSASVIKVLALILTALSTIVLGIPAIPARASIALPLVALVTLLTALEGFFNWRSRWVLMEETQYRLNRLRDEIDYYLVATPSSEVTWERLNEFFQDQQIIWGDVSHRWVEFRKHDGPNQSEQVPDLRSVT